MCDWREIAAQELGFIVSTNWDPPSFCRRSFRLRLRRRSSLAGRGLCFVRRRGLGTQRDHVCDGASRPASGVQERFHGCRVLVVARGRARPAIPKTRRGTKTAGSNPSDAGSTAADATHWTLRAMAKAVGLRPRPCRVSAAHGHHASILRMNPKASVSGPPASNKRATAEAPRQPFTDSQKRRRNLTKH